METHHWEILARIFGIIQFFNLVSLLPSTTSYYQFFSFFLAIYYFYLFIITGLSLSLFLSLSLTTHTYLVELLWFADHFDMAI